MSFDVKNNNFNINIKTFNTVSNNTKNIFSNNVYKDIPKFDFKKYNNPSDKRFDFNVSSKNLAFKLYESKTKKEFSFVSLINGVVDLGKTVGASIVNTVTGFAEGLISFGEAIIDCAALVVGGVASIGTAIWDVGKGIFTGDWSFSTTSAMWKKGIMPFVGTDFTDKAFDKLYDTSFMKSVDNSAHDWFKRDTGVVYSISEGVGYYTGMIIATTLTCGAMGGGVAASTTTKVATISTKTIAQAGFTAAGSMGKNTQKGYNDAVAVAKAEGREVSMGDIGKVLGHSGSKAVLDGGIMFTAGAVGDSISAAKDAVAAGKDVSKLTGVIAKVGGGTKQAITTTVKATKAYISEGVDCLFTGEDYNFRDANIDAAGTVVAEYLAFGVGKIAANGGVFTNSDHSKSWNVPKVEYVKAAKNVSGATEALAKAFSPIKATFVNTGRVLVNSLEAGGIKGIEKIFKETGSTITEAAGNAIFKGD